MVYGGKHAQSDVLKMSEEEIEYKIQKVIEIRKAELKAGIHS